MDIHFSGGGILALLFNAAKIILRSLNLFGKGLITPSVAIRQPDQLRQARLLAAMQVVSIGFGLAFLLFSSHNRYYAGTQSHLITLLAIGFLALAYLLSRSGRFYPAAWVTVGILSLSIFLLTFFTDGIPVDPEFLVYLLLPLLFASIFLTPSAILLLGGLYGCAIYFSAVTLLGFDPIAIVGGPIFFVLIATGMIYLLARQRNGLETIRKQELAEKERLYRTLFENANDAIFLISLENLYIAVNEKAADMLGYTLGELVGMPISQVVVPREYPDALRVKQMLLAGQRPPIYQRIFRRKDGAEFPVEINATLIYDVRGQPLCLQSIVRDITQRKRMEDELHSLALFPDEDPSPVIRISAGLRLLYANAASQPLLDVWRGQWRAGLPPELLAAAKEVLDHKTPKSLEVNCGAKIYSFVIAPITRQGYVNLYGQDSTERKHKETQIQNQLTRLQVTRHIEEAITSSLDLHTTLKVLLSLIIEHFAVAAADILLYNPRSQMLEITSRLGFLTNALRFTKLPIGEGYAGQAALERKIIRIEDLAETPGGLSQSNLLTGEGLRTYTAVPLIAKGQIKGVLEIFHCQVMEPDAEWEEFLQSLAAQAAIAIDNAQLYQDAQRSSTELSLAYDATLVGWARALELRDKETEGHSQRVTQMTVRLGQALGIKDEALVHLRRGALLHDIGKMGIPDTILLKPGPLSDEEWETMRKHPQYAVEMLSPIAYLRPALDIPFGHHEKWDGSGYPQGLVGTAIPLAARIFAVVDVWDALTSDRPYRPRWPEAKVREYIQSLSGTHLDPDVVRTFFSLLDSDF